MTTTTHPPGGLPVPDVPRPGRSQPPSAAVRFICATTSQRVIDIPPTLTGSQRVQWIAGQVTKFGITMR